VYVAKSGALALRDLATGAETTLETAAEAPRRPSVTAGGALVAWEYGGTGVSGVRVKNGASTITLTGAFAYAGEPRAGGTAVAFTASAGPLATSDTDVWLFDAATGKTALAVGGPAQQRFADVSARWLAVTDFTETPDGLYHADGTDLADVVVLDRMTGTLTRRAAPGKQAFPMLTSTDLVGYLDWSAIHPEPKLVEYQLKAGAIGAEPATDRVIADVRYVASDYARPAAFSGTLEWIANPDGQTVLWRAPADGSAAPAAVSGLDGLVLYAPAPSAGFTILAAAAAAASAPDFSPRLRAVPRGP
jgi:hypothetical protein